MMIKHYRISAETSEKQGLATLLKPLAKALFMITRDIPGVRIDVKATSTCESGKALRDELVEMEIYGGGTSAGSAVRWLVEQYGAPRK